MDRDRVVLTRLLGRCPYEGGPKGCALAAVRAKRPRQQLAWLRSLSERDIVELCRLHAQCACNQEAQIPGVFDDA